MGRAANIALDRFPKQGEILHARCTVCFHYDTSRTIGGTIVREDVEAPHEIVIRLDDGRYVLAGECMYSPEYPATKAEGR